MSATFFKNQNFYFQRHCRARQNLTCRQKSIIVFGLRLFHLRHYRQDVAAIHDTAKISFQWETTKKLKVKYIVHVKARLMKNIARLLPTCRRYCRRWNSKMFMPAVMSATCRKRVAVVEQHYNSAVPLQQHYQRHVGNRYIADITTKNL